MGWDFALRKGHDTPADFVLRRCLMSLRRFASALLRLTGRGLCLSWSLSARLRDPAGWRDYAGVMR
jgi:hypothetical protein